MFSPLEIPNAISRLVAIIGFSAASKREFLGENPCSPWVLVFMGLDWYKTRFWYKNNGYIMGMIIVIHDEMGLVMAGILSFTQLYLYWLRTSGGLYWKEGPLHAFIRQHTDVLGYLKGNFETSICLVWIPPLWSGFRGYCFRNEPKRRNLCGGFMWLP